MSFIEIYDKLSTMDWLNYNQFFYFWVIAQEMSITQASKRLRVSQSNLSEQLKDFESSLGVVLFERTTREIKLTESGRLAMDYANTVFSSGQEMIDVFKNRPVKKKKEVLRIGSISSLSKNLQFEFIRPLLKTASLKFDMVEGDLGALVRQLQNHALDLVISNIPARTDSTPEVFNHRLGQVQVSLIGTPDYRGVAKGFPKSLANKPLLLPSRTGRFRSDFDAWMERERIELNIKAEIEDMALLRLFALSGEGIALVPEIVVQRELATGELIVLKRLPDLVESFFAVTITRKFPNPNLERIVKRLSVAFSGRGV